MVQLTGRDADSLETRNDGSVVVMVIQILITPTPKPESMAPAGMDSGLLGLRCSTARYTPPNIYSCHLRVPRMTLLGYQARRAFAFGLSMLYCRSKTPPVEEFALRKHYPAQCGGSMKLHLD